MHTYSTYIHTRSFSPPDIRRAQGRRCDGRWRPTSELPILLLVAILLNISTYIHTYIIHTYTHTYIIHTSYIHHTGVDVWYEYGCILAYIRTTRMYNTYMYTYKRKDIRTTYIHYRSYMSSSLLINIEALHRIQLHSFELLCICMYVCMYVCTV